jgi:hypothetical protein
MVISDGAPDKSISKLVRFSQHQYLHRLGVSVACFVWSGDFIPVDSNNREHVVEAKDEVFFHSVTDLEATKVEFTPYLLDSFSNVFPTFNLVNGDSRAVNNLANALLVWYKLNYKGYICAVKINMYIKPSFFSLQSTKPNQHELHSSLSTEWILSHRIELKSLLFLFLFCFKKTPTNFYD